MLVSLKYILPSLAKVKLVSSNNKLPEDVIALVPLPTKTALEVSVETPVPP